MNEESPLIRIRGSASPEKIEERRKEFAQRYKSQDFGFLPEGAAEILKENEIPLTEIQKTIATICNEVTNEYMVSLGLESRSIPAENVHIFPEGIFNTLYGEGAEATSSPNEQAICINEGTIRGEELSYFASTTLHEMIQAKGMDVWWESGASNELQKELLTFHRQWGLSIPKQTLDASGEKKFSSLMEGLEEAVVVDIQKELFKKVFAKRPFKKERDDTVRGKERRLKKQAAEEYGVPLDDIYRAMERNGGVQVYRMPYVDQRKVFDYLSQQISEETGMKLLDVKKVFHKAHFTARLLEIGRLMKKTFGEEGLRTLSRMGNGASPDFISGQVLKDLKALRAKQKK